LAGGPNVRVVMDRRLRTPPGAKLLTVTGPILIYTETDSGEQREALTSRGAEVIVLPSVEPGSVLSDLHRRGVQSVLVEGGAEVLASFVTGGCYDRVMVDCAPLLVGGRNAPGPLGGDGFPVLAAAPRLEGLEARRRGGDVLLAGYRQGCLGDLLET